MRKAYLIERRIVGNPTWVLTGSGFYNPAIKDSADACCRKWNALGTDSELPGQHSAVAVRYEYRVRTYARP